MSTLEAKLKAKNPPKLTIGQQNKLPKSELMRWMVGAAQAFFQENRNYGFDIINISGIRRPAYGDCNKPYACIALAASLYAGNEEVGRNLYRIGMSEVFNDELFERASGPRQSFDETCDWCLRLADHLESVGV